MDCKHNAFLMEGDKKKCLLCGAYIQETYVNPPKTDYKPLPDAKKGKSSSRKKTAQNVK